MIRSSKHSLKFANICKLSELNLLIIEYKRLVNVIVNHVWEHGYRGLKIQQNRLNCPSMMDCTFLENFPSTYTERLKQAAAKQALSMISAATEKRRKQLWQLRKLQKLGEKPKYLQRKINLFPLIKPDTANINLELDSRFVDFDFSDQSEFLCFIRLTSFKKGCSIKIPAPYSPVYTKWIQLGTLKKSIRLNQKNVHLFFDAKETDKAETGSIIGCDQGIKDVVMLSDGQSAKLYQDRYSLSDVQHILARKKKGSKAFLRTQDFRKNVINWSINQLNFSGVKELRLERLFQVGKGRGKSRYLSHWTYALINDKLKRVSEEKGFLLREVPNEFRSQRCSECGWVRKANRKGKTFTCDKCSNALDADLNAATNLMLDLYEIPFWVRLRKINRSGFYWKPEGIFSECQEPIVPDATKE